MMKQSADEANGYFTYDSSPVGRLLLASDSQKVTGIWLEGQKYYGLQTGRDMKRNDEIPVLKQAKKWLDLYFSGEKPQISDLPLAPAGSRFRQEVWKLLCRIPYGTVTTYGDIAKEMAAIMGKPSMSGQAVGGAVGHNPISIVIPCHRVVGANGSLTGYAGGLRTKIKLLTLERTDLTGLFVPEKGTAL